MGVQGEILTEVTKPQVEVDPFATLHFAHTSFRPERQPVEPLPDLLPLSDEELAALRVQLEEAEDAVSKRRRLLHGRIDILRAERTARLKAQVAAGSFEAHTPRSLDRPIYEGTGDVPADGDFEPLPDLPSMDDDALWAEIRRLEHEEDDISLNRRVIHAQIDIIVAERKKRLQAGEHVEAEDLGSILGGGT
jgi:hypothetical protein